MHISGAHPCDRLPDQRRTRHVRYRQEGTSIRYFEFGAESFEELKIYASHSFRIDPALQSFCDNFGQGNDRCEARRIRRPVTVLAISKFLHAMHHAHGHFPAADGTAVIVVDGFLGGQTHPAVAVTVIMILALLREKFNRAEKALPRFYRLHHRSVRDLRVKDIGFTPYLPC